MASPYKMKNSMLKMAAKGAPMQKNYAGSPMHDKDDKDPNPPVYNQQDSSWAIGMRRQRLRDQTKTYRPSLDEVRKGDKYKAKIQMRKLKSQETTAISYQLLTIH